MMKVFALTVLVAVGASGFSSNRNSCPTLQDAANAFESHFGTQVLENCRKIPVTQERNTEKVVQEASVFLLLHFYIFPDSWWCSGLPVRGRQLSLEQSRGLRGRLWGRDRDPASGARPGVPRHDGGLRDHGRGLPQHGWRPWLCPGGVRCQPQRWDHRHDRDVRRRLPRSAWLQRHWNVKLMSTEFNFLSKTFPHLVIKYWL